MFFFQFLFPSYCHSIGHRVVSIVSDDRNQSSFVFFLSSLRVVVSMRQRCLQCWQVLFLPLFFYTYSRSTSSLGCNSLYIVNRFLVLLSICLSSYLVHFRKGPEYLTGDSAQVFIPLIRFLLDSFILCSFLVLLRYSFWILSFFPICLMMSAFKMPKYL